MNNFLVTIITPTTGKKSLKKLIASLEIQSIPHVHLLLWDNKREDEYLYPNFETFKIATPYDLEKEDDNRIVNSIVIKGNMISGEACGSSLRSVGLMIAQTQYVTFADDDVWFEKNHLEKMINLIKDKEWAYCRRKIWTKDMEYLGIDNFESVGIDTDKKVPYEMVDNSCMIFTRRYGTSGAVLYRETKQYNDDRLFYSFLKKYAGEPSITKEATVNQVCPSRLEKMFRQYCDKNVT